MRLKNLNLFEKYIEKAVLGLAVVYALAVLWFFVIGSPHAVELQALHKELPPSQIEDAILTEANDLDRRISSRESPFKLLQVPPYTDEFRGRLSRPLIPVDSLATFFGLPGLNIKHIKINKQDYYVPPRPIPSDLIWDTGFGVLAEPQDPTLVPQFEKLIGDQKPRDFRWVSISAQFNMKQWREELAARPPKDYKQIPKTWWRDRLIITDVQLERQVQDPNTGKWGEPQVLPPVPGTDRFDFLNNTKFSFRSERTNWAPPEADKALAISRIEQKRLPRPLFPELSEGLWLPPDANSQTMPLQLADQVHAKVKQIKEVQKQIKEMKQRIADGTAPVASKRPPGALNNPNGAPAAPAIDLPSLENRRDTLRDELYVLLGIIEPVEPKNDTIINTRSGPFGSKPLTIAQTQENDEFATPDTVRIWQHDISVKDGQSIRYRVKVSVLNPLFFRSQLPKGQDGKPGQYDEYHDKLTLSSKYSSWTEPVQVLSEHHFFLIAASKATRTATVEVYCIFNGQWQRREFDVKPGDPIGQIVQFQHDGQPINVNMNVGGVVVDVDYDAPSAESPNKRTTRLIYYDGRTNTLQTRTLEQDQNDPKRLELKKKLKSAG